MDRNNREGRRATNMAAPSNGLSSSRRRYRSSGLRDSPDEEGGVELQESGGGRLRDRGGVGKNNRDRDRERERERERERLSSSRIKRRRENRMIIHHHHVNNNNNNTGGSNNNNNTDDTSEEESVNDEEEEDDEGGNGGGLRTLHPPPINPSTAASALTSNSSQQQLQFHSRKIFPPSANNNNKVFNRGPPAAPPPAWKAADEMIGVSVPRKARSASTKRSHEWISGVAGVGGADQIHRQSSTSPVRLAAPPSPSSSNVSLRKKMKANGGGSKPKPPKSSSKSSSSNPEELEIEIAEVLYGLMTQSQAPSKKENEKFDSNKSTSSRVSSPISNSTTLPQNSTSLSTVAPKRKKPRQVSENPFNARSSPVTKTGIDQSLKADISSPYLETNNSTPSAAAAENGDNKAASSPSSEPPEDERKCGVLTKEEVEKESLMVTKLNDGNCKTEAVITTAAVKLVNPETQSQKDEKFEIDLMAPPPQQRTCHGMDGDIGFTDHKQQMETREDDKLRKSDTEEQKAVQETVEPSKQSVNEEINIQLNIDLEKPNKGSGSSNRSLHQALKHQQLSTKSETHSEKTAQSSSMPIPMSMANWPPMGKVANSETQIQKDEKFEIDLMAPPHGSTGDIDFSDHKQQENRDDDKLKKSDPDEHKAGTIQETVEPSKQSVNEEVNIQLSIDLEKPNKGSASMASGSSNRSLHQSLKHQQLPAKSETHSEKTAQSSSLPIPMSMANWPPMGYVAPLQGVISVDGNTMAPAPIQPLFTHPRPKRCATHCYIARNIHYLQQFMKNPFWPAASGSVPPMFGAKPCNLNVMPSTELHANIPQLMHDKGQAVGIFPGHTTGKDTKSSQPATINDPAQRKQQVLLQQAMPPVAPNNILHGPAFIFPFNQQQAVTASASARLGSSKLTTSPAAGSLVAASSASHSATVSSSTTAAAPALSFSYPNMGANETQYLAILQNNPYSFPVPAVGAPPNYRPNPHAQAMPLFNGSFYSSQMIHPSQIPQPPQQATPPTQAQNHHPSQSQQTHQNSSGSTSSSQKHLQAQQRQQGSGATAVNGSGGGNGGSLHNSYHVAHKSRSQQSSQQQNQHMNPALQVRHLENEATGGEDSPSTADSRGSRAANTMSVYGHNFAMPVHNKVFAQMDHSTGALAKASGSAATVGANSNDKKQQQQQQGLKRGGAEQSLPPQTFAMSFAPMNGTSGGTMSQNHAIFQSLPDSVRQGYHMMAAPAAATTAHQKDFRISEEAAARTSHDSSNADEDRKVSSGLAAKSGQSIAFSRPDLATDASGSNNRSSRSPIPTSIGSAAPSSHPLHAQFQQQQQVFQLQKQQQQNQSMNSARSKNPPSSNGSAYPEHLITSSSSMTAKFPNSISSFPLQTSNTSNSPVQSPQWRNSVRGPTPSQVPSSLSSAATTSSLKNLHQTQQQSSRSHPSHTQISFSATTSQKLQPATSVQNQNPSSNSGNQSPSSPMLVGSPTTASASTSGRTGQASLSSSQQAKNSPVGTQRSLPSILGTPNNSNSNKSQQPPQKQTLHQQKAQTMMMYPPYIQVQQAQAQQHAASSMAASGYSLYRMQQQQSPQQPSPSSSSTAMLSLCSPVTHANSTTSDPAKAIAAATNMMYPAGFPQFVHSAPAAAAAAAAAAVQAKPAEQKQPAA